MNVSILVDYQYDFVKGALGFKEAENLDNYIYNALLLAEHNGDKIYETKDTHYSGYANTQEGKKLPIKHCEFRSVGHNTYGHTGDLIASLISEGKVEVINKPTFGSLDLAMRLSQLDMQLRVYKSDKIRVIRIHGLVSNICVISNAILAKSAVPEAEIIVDNWTCGSGNIELHNKALDVMESLQIKVINR